MTDLVDSHVHLDDREFDVDRAMVMERALLAGVQAMVVPATGADGWQNLATLCTSHPGLHPAFGLHPLFIDDHELAHVEMLSSWLDHDACVAVGEIGLDFHLDTLDPESQRFYFKAQLDLAQERGLPVIVHARAALEEVSLTLRRRSGLRGVVHSFSGSEQQAGQLWDAGFHLGIGGTVTYDRAQRLRRIVADMPIEFLLLESDAPDQPDSSHRGQRNEPARVVEVLRCVAALRGESEDHVAAATTANAYRLFGLDRHKD